MSFSPNGYDFVPKGGVVYDAGKPHWRDCVNIILDMREAIRVLAMIANWLESQPDDDEKLTLGSCGLLQKCEQGNWPHDDPEVE